MTIGQLLKQYRIESQKTQKEWAGNIISSSFYAKVEKNIHRITVNDLIDLLHYNQISLLDFFSKLDRREQQQYTLKEELSNQVVEAYYHNSKDELEQIRQIINKSDLPDKDENSAFVTAYIALLDNNLEALDKETKEKIKNKLYDISNFNEDNLYLYCNFMSFFDLDSNLILAKRLVQHFQGREELAIQEAILSIIINLIMLCIKERKYSKTPFFIEAAAQIKTGPKLAFYKNVLALLVNMIDYHYQPEDCYLDNIKIIINNFALIGMPEYGEKLEKFFTENK